MSAQSHTPAVIVLKQLWGIHNSLLSIALSRYSRQLINRFDDVFCIEYAHFFGAVPMIHHAIHVISVMSANNFNLSGVHSISFFKYKISISSSIKIPSEFFFDGANYGNLFRDGVDAWNEGEPIAD